MKLIIVAALLVGAFATLEEDQTKWAEFKAQYGKNYGMGGDSYRFGVFQNNLRTAEENQKNSPTATFGVTKFMDLTPAEFHSMYAGLNITQVRSWRRHLPTFVPTSRQVGADWRGTRVTGVKDQGQCGSCWAFSAAAAAEACTAVVSKLTDLSAQQIVDCCTAGGSNGCNGGYPDLCLSWGMNNNLATWASYPYHTSKGACSTSFTVGLPKGNCGYHAVSGGESGTISALSHNPVSVCLDAAPLQTYKTGIISGSTCSQHSVDHAVLLVASDATTVTIKNSWGTGWGEAGYFRMAINVNCLAYTTENSLVY